jgi:hypothetical protein
MPLDGEDDGEGESDGKKKPGRRKNKATGETEDPAARTSNVKPFAQPRGEAAE